MMRRDKPGRRGVKAIIAVGLVCALASSQARAGERVGDAALGATSDAELMQLAIGGEVGSP